MGTHASTGLALVPIVILWKRAIQVLAAGLAIRELRIIVSLRRETDQPTTGSVQIMNLRPEHQRRLTQLVKNEERLIILAGHSGRLEQMFDGLPKEVGNERQRTEVVTRIRVGSMHGAAETAVTGWISNTTWQSGTTLISFVTDIINDFLVVRDEERRITDVFLTIGDTSLLTGKTLSTKVTATGRSATGVMREVLAEHELTWSENDGVIEFSQANQVSGGQSAPIFLSRNTGLLYLPIPTDEGVDAVSLLQPRARLGGTVVIQSKRLSGRYRIVGVQHNADNWTGRFHTHFRMRAFGEDAASSPRPRRIRARPVS